MLIFLILLNIGFSIFNFSRAEEIESLTFFVGVFNMLAACFISFVFGRVGN